MKRDKELDSYFIEIRSYPLLDRETEKRLATSVQNNYVRYKKEGIGIIISKDSLPSIYEAMREGTESRNKLINSNLLLVAKIARKYTNRGLPLEDLIQEGNQGLIKAVDHYDPNQNARFATYATYWIEKEIKRALRGRPRHIKIPANLITDIYNLKKWRESLIETLGREPTKKELAERLNLKGKTLETIYQGESAMDKNKEIISIYKEIFGTNRTLIETIKDKKSKDIIDELEIKELESLIEKAIKKERDREILKIRYSIIQLNGTNQNPTLEEIGEKYNLSRERIRQIEKKCLTKLRKVIKTQERKVLM